jgi:hypothetical protein
MHSDSLVIR